MFLVGDVGGTNTTVASVKYDSGRFSIIAKERYPSAGISGVSEAIDGFMENEGLTPTSFESCCISGAGPVQDNVCRMTNVSWIIDGSDLETRLGVPTHIINDFSAICYALPFIESHPEIETVPFAHTDGSFPPPSGNVRAVVGAGTGLGTGYLVEDRGHFTAHPSEAGHSGFAPADDDMLAVYSMLRTQIGDTPGVELFVSGQGIANVYECFRHAGRLPDDEITREIDALAPSDRPARVARAATEHDGLASVMRLFVRMYAVHASNTALCFLPTGGLYLAGGIAAKNEQWFINDKLFMSTFEENYNERIRPLLRTIPVILIKDYSVSLYGAAHAAVSLG